MPFAQHYQQTLEELARVCASCGRDPREVKVIAVSKTVDVPAISAAIQSRKIPEIVACATLVHSVCKEEHFAKFDQAAERLGKVQDILLEVNVSGEESKSGFTPDEAIHALQLAETFPHIAVRGLMTMAPQGNLDVARECFEGLAALRDALRSQLPSEQAARFNELSMGMSEDWREAVCAGATMVRIGRALFSDSFESVRA